MSEAHSRRGLPGASRWLRCSALLFAFWFTTAAADAAEATTAIEATAVTEAASAPPTPAGSTAPADGEQILIPNSSLNVKAPGTAGGTGSGALTMVGVLGLAGAGGWLLWRGRGGSLKQFNRVPRQLAVEETRSLGNRQFLVVASYQDKKFLIGVCPGRIDLLSALHASPSAETEKSRS
jgi:flagellar protein FliO/FliZ